MRDAYEPIFLYAKTVPKPSHNLTVAPDSAVYPSRGWHALMGGGPMRPKPRRLAVLTRSRAALVVLSTRAVLGARSRAAFSIPAQARSADDFLAGDELS